MRLVGPAQYEAEQREELVEAVQLGKEEREIELMKISVERGIKKHNSGWA